MMKKNVSLIALALVAIMAQAQEREYWSATEFNVASIESSQLSGPNFKKVSTIYESDPETFDQVFADATEDLVLNNYEFTTGTESVTLKGVSTLNSDGETQDAWRRQAGASTNQALNTDDCPEKWPVYLNAKTGNPSLAVVQYFFINSGGQPVGPRLKEKYWEPGCGELPAKGEYFEVTFSQPGTFMVGLFINRPSSNLYIVEKESIELIPADQIKIEGFVTHNTATYGGLEKAYQTLKVNDDYTISHPEVDIPNKQILAFVTFEVEAKTYLMFNPKNQLGIYGYRFTPVGYVDAIQSPEQEAEDAPTYNLSGQQVAPDAKGYVIKAGKKYLNK